MGMGFFSVLCCARRTDSGQPGGMSGSTEVNFYPQVFCVQDNAGGERSKVSKARLAAAASEHLAPTDMLLQTSAQPWWVNKPSTVQFLINGRIRGHYWRKGLRDSLSAHFCKSTGEWDAASVNQGRLGDDGCD